MTQTIEMEPERGGEGLAEAAESLWCHFMEFTAQKDI